MKKTLAVFALVAISVAVVVFTSAQSQNGGPKFRRVRAEKKIANQYIVVLKDDVGDVDGEAFRLARDFGGDRNGGFTYNRAIKGFSVRMNEQQALRLADDGHALADTQGRRLSLPRGGIVESVVACYGFLGRPARFDTLRNRSASGRRGQLHSAQH